MVVPILLLVAFVAAGYFGGLWLEETGRARNGVWMGVIAAIVIWTLVVPRGRKRRGDDSAHAGMDHHDSGDWDDSGCGDD